MGVIFGIDKWHQRMINIWVRCQGSVSSQVRKWVINRWSEVWRSFSKVYELIWLLMNLLTGESWWPYKQKTTLWKNNFTVTNKVFLAIIPWSLGMRLMVGPTLRLHMNTTTITNFISIFLYFDWFLFISSDHCWILNALLTQYLLFSSLTTFLFTIVQLKIVRPFACGCALRCALNYSFCYGVNWLLWASVYCMWSIF